LMSISIKLLHTIEVKCSKSDLLVGPDASGLSTADLLPLFKQTQI